jgi:CopG family transcriptional regulator / antitoxin EndoAI
MYRRINVSLPIQTLELLDKFVPSCDRSRFIHEAIQYYTAKIQRERLIQQLKEGAIRRGERDRTLTEDWFSIEEA